MMKRPVWNTWRESCFHLIANTLELLLHIGLLLYSPLVEAQRNPHQFDWTDFVVYPGQRRVFSSHCQARHNGNPEKKPSPKACRSTIPWGPSSSALSTNSSYNEHYTMPVKSFRRATVPPSRPSSSQALESIPIGIIPIRVALHIPWLTTTRTHIP